MIISPEECYVGLRHGQMECTFEVDLSSSHTVAAGSSGEIFIASVMQRTLSFELLYTTLTPLKECHTMRQVTEYE